MKNGKTNIEQETRFHNNSDSTVSQKLVLTIKLNMILNMKMIMQDKFSLHLYYSSQHLSNFLGSFNLLKAPRK